jgi:hypothetical protein
MVKDHIQQDQSAVFKRFRRPRQRSTLSSSSFSVSDQQRKDRYSLINQMPNINKRSK